ncbi:hypothetical protein [Xanthomonas sacchari]|uniref:hypothetical protein n=1 Tax=Xanthomonas sacchari TaxID=56458 RepID=UPI00224F827E|nr:hypothetical protein [Xanthomonas sacchari]UYK72562.1 hypothetical protein NG828_20635 [Xanthomonas sacchari]
MSQEAKEGDSPRFAEIDAAAKESLEDVESGKSKQEISPASPDSMVEIYRNQHELSEEANRSLRGQAFVWLGVACLVYLGCLLIALLSLIDNSSLALLLRTDGTNWHALILLGLILVIFAAVPLSLAMALVKMISRADQETGGKGSGITTPQLELFKVFLEMVKAAKP